MKALDEYFLMVVFTLLLSRIHIFANIMFNLDREKQWKAIWPTTHLIPGGNGGRPATTGEKGIPWTSPVLNNLDPGPPGIPWGVLVLRGVVSSCEPWLLDRILPFLFRCWVNENLMLPGILDFYERHDPNLLSKFERTRYPFMGRGLGCNFLHGVQRDLNRRAKCKIPWSQRFSFAAKRRERKKWWEKTSGCRRCESHYIMLK